MKRSVILPCAGEGERWGQHLGVPKQLAPVGGEALVARTVRLLRARGVESIRILAGAQREAFEGMGAEVVVPEERRYLTDALRSSRDFWGGEETVVLLGDVFFTERALDAALAPATGVRFFGIEPSDPLVDEGIRRPEIFAFAFTRHAADAVSRALERSSALARIRDDFGGRHRRLGALDAGRFVARGRAVARSIGDRVRLIRDYSRFAYPPKPPRIVRRVLPRAELWRWLRLSTGRSRGARIHGKLWGVYLLLEAIDPFGGEGFDWPNPSSEHFYRIADETRDCDEPEDYTAICSSLTDAASTDD